MGSVEGCQGFRRGVSWVPQRGVMGSVEGCHGFRRGVSGVPQRGVRGSVEGCQGFRETKTRNGGRVSLVVLNLYVRIKTRAATFDTNHSVTVSP